MPSASATDLAVLRIATALLLLLAADVWGGPALAAELASWPPSALTPPLGTRGLFSALPPAAATAHAARAGVLLGASLGLLGTWAQTGFALAALCAGYLLALPSLAGAPVHNHHLVWMSALLAASPCADALTVRGRGRGPARHGSAYTLPVRAAWVLIGAVFFFPGLWKLLVSGTDWIFGDNLRNHLYWKWTQSWDHPRLRVDRLPGLTQAAALGVVAFELAFGVLVWFGRTRTAAVAAALAFHALTAAVMDVRFSTLWPLYVAFFAWDRRPAEGLRAARLGGWAVAATLVVGAVAAGAAGEVRSWPFACYPTFAETVGETMPVLAVTVVRGGQEIPVPLAAMVDPEPVVWARLWRLAGIGGPVDPAALEGFWAEVRQRPGMGTRLVGAEEVRLYRAEMSVVPEHWGEPPRRLRLLHAVSP